MANFSEIELMLYCYAACAWTGFGTYAVSADRWSCREAFGRTIHAANAGMVVGFMSFSFIGLTRPWQFIGVACSTSMGWTRKDDIKNLVSRLLKGDKDESP